MSETGNAERITVDVAVIGQGRYDDRGVLVGACRIVSGDRWIIFRSDSDVDGSRVRSAVSITDGVIKGVAAVVVPIRRVGQTAITVVGDRSARALREGIDAERITVRVTIIVQDGDRNGRIFQGCCAVVVGGWIRVRCVECQVGDLLRRMPTFSVPQEILFDGKVNCGAINWVGS